MLQEFDREFTTRLVQHIQKYLSTSKYMAIFPNNFESWIKDCVDGRFNNPTFAGTVKEGILVHKDIPGEDDELLEMIGEEILEALKLSMPAFTYVQSEAKHLKLLLSYLIDSKVLLDDSDSKAGGLSFPFSP